MSEPATNSATETLHREVVRVLLRCPDNGYKEVVVDVFEELPLQLRDKCRISDVKDLENSLRKCFQLFQVTTIGDQARPGLTYVALTTTLTFCSLHSSQAGSCKDGTCAELHICLYFLLSGHCEFGTDCCRFGHDLHTAHNLRLLWRHGLEDLSLDQIRTLFCLPRVRRGIACPQLCRFYSTNLGKGCGKKDNCRFLHVCCFHINGKCRFGDACSYNHSFQDPHVKRVLELYGVSTGRAPEEIAAELKLYHSNSGATHLYSGEGCTYRSPYPDQYDETAQRENLTSIYGEDKDPEPAACEEGEIIDDDDDGDKDDQEDSHGETSPVGRRHAISQMVSGVRKEMYSSTQWPEDDDIDRYDSHPGMSDGRGRRYESPCAPKVDGRERRQNSSRTSEHEMRHDSPGISQDGGRGRCDSSCKPENDGSGYDSTFTSGEEERSCESSSVTEEGAGCSPQWSEDERRSYESSPTSGMKRYGSHWTSEAGRRKRDSPQRSGDGTGRRHVSIYYTLTDDRRNDKSQGTTENKSRFESLQLRLSNKRRRESPSAQFADTETESPGPGEFDARQDLRSALNYKRYNEHQRMPNYGGQRKHSSHRPRGNRSQRKARRFNNHKGSGTLSAHQLGESEQSKRAPSYPANVETTWDEPSEKRSRHERRWLYDY